MPFSLRVIMPLALGLRGEDTVLVRPLASVSGGGRAALQRADRKHGRREIYFLPAATGVSPSPSGGSGSDSGGGSGGGGDRTIPVVRGAAAAAAAAAVLHLNGWDLYASRCACAE